MVEARPAHEPDRRGILYPTKLPTFHREPAPEGLANRVRWFWIPRWDLPPGRTSRQEVLSFPASNLVVQGDGVTLSGPTTGATHRDLVGRGWAVGALLRPGGITGWSSDPATLRDQEVSLEAPALHRAIVTAMGRDDQDEAVSVFVDWLQARIPEPDDQALLANAMEDLIAGDRSIVRVDQIADRLGLSVRGVQRLAQRHVGVAPLSMIRRYRLQEAAQRLRQDPSLTISHVAAELGYADHAHLSADFRTVLGFTAQSYRRIARD